MPCDKKCCCCEKNTQRTDEEKKKLINRLNRIEGQVRGIKGMIEKDAYCADVLVQSAAVNAAINSFNKDLLSRHIQSCVVRDIKSGDEEVVDELMNILSKLMK
jgi:CsoR family transcriptional regulator, copper-sensing transcriptional repressor